jgi:hypothetical protein
MSFASDIQAVTISSTALAVQGRTRMAGVIFTSTDTAADLTFRDGSATGNIVFRLKSPAGPALNDMMIPDDGIVFKSGIHVTISNSTHVPSLTVLFVGGQGGNTVLASAAPGVSATGSLSQVTVPITNADLTGVNGTGGVSGVTVSV